MTEEKLREQIDLLASFSTTYCHSKHGFTDGLCPECQALYDYALDRLKACPHDPKPRCRHCPAPCYEKKQWKAMATMMRYSGIKLGLLKIFNRFATKS